MDIFYRISNQYSFMSKKASCFASMFNLFNDIAGTSCLRDLVLSVPPAATLGETVQLNCSYHLQGESLYAIKLYKGRNEFLTYAAERTPPLRSFPLKGIHLQVSNNTLHQRIE